MTRKSLPGLKSNPKVTIVDYGMGNIRSLVAALNYLGARVEITSNPAKIAQARTVILPGVGSFPSAMKTIRSRGFDVALQETLGQPFAKLLGICLGMQLLGQKSEEDGGAEGLGFLDFEVREFSIAKMRGLPIPHIGFNVVKHDSKSSLFQGLDDSAEYYFVHEFQCVLGQSNALESVCTYGDSFLAAVEDGNVIGTQFHPEKSQTNGLRVLANFLDER